MTSPMAQHTSAKPFGSASPSQGASAAFGSMSTPSQLTALDGRLGWLDLNTRAPVVNRALNTMFSAAMQDGTDANRAGRFLLSLWSPDQYPLDLNDLGFFERELNYACRHLANFIIACQVSFRQLVTQSQMEPIIAAWGEEHQ
ncbi:hypothetical protein KZZ05_08470 [Marinobacter adhaerens]|uniref:DUF7673 family protein n=1 Tax=Marinobacter adhaerens TaxID=1033846 RepID=UPI001C5E534D|nr:hypothetical protein [Marinobacter adhaerens]MBW4978307.1 hypothetical protein [Marinobacter adhaerens]